MFTKLILLQLNTALPVRQRSSCCTIRGRQEQDRIRNHQSGQDNRTDLIGRRTHLPIKSMKKNIMISTQVNSLTVSFDDLVTRFRIFWKFLNIQQITRECLALHGRFLTNSISADWSLQKTGIGFSGRNRNNSIWFYIHS